MTQQYLRQGGALDILTKSEVQEAMGHSFDQGIRDLLRGVDYLTFTGGGNPAALVTIPGPEQGYTWSVKLASVQLSTAGQFCVYVGENANTPPIASIASDPANQAIASWTSNIAVLKDGRALTFTCSAGTINTWMLRVKQVPTEMQGKL